MSKEIYISSTPHETRLAIVENDDLTEIYYERENEYTLAGSIYNGRVTRVLPGMQSSFVDIGLERDAFLYITDFMEEAGDTADFDTSGDHSRSDNRRGGNRETPVTLEGTPVAPAAPAEESGNRSERGGRDRGRGRNDRRRGNRDRQPSPENPSPAENTEAPMDLDQESDFGPHPDTLSAEPRDNGEIGEGAPGADGSRRWRGRRGRRRSRPGQRDTVASPVSSDAQPEFAAPANPEEQDEDQYDSDLDLEGAAEQAAPRNSAPIPAAYPAPEAAPESTERNDRHDRNDRGGRSDRGGRNDRGGRDRDRGRRAPRGFAPRTSLYGVDDTPNHGSASAEADGSTPEPIVLPGESLSKYRKDGDPQSEAPKAAEPTIVLSSAPGYEVPAGWDGGATLPGETLSRHRRSESRESRQEPRAEHRLDSQASLRNDHIEPQTVAHEAVEAQPVEQAAAPAHEAVPTEYEPTEASASYRVDPVAPSEFRQSAPVVEEPAEQVVEHAEEPAVHEITAIHATGEMETEAPVGAFAPEQVIEPASPIQHETVIANHIENVVEDGIEPAHHHFAPGAGELEEEVIDDEDYATTLQASSFEEIDDFGEEETLEGAADLGTMIREMSIDEITSSGNSLAEEDDLEELEEEDSFDDGTHEYEEDLEDSDSEDESEDEDLHEESAEDGEVSANGSEQSQTATPGYERPREGERKSSRRDGGRRDGRRGERGRGDRPRYTGGAGDRERSGGRDRRGGRNSMQTTNLPAISELLKPGQEVLVQIAKEPIAKKGARITSHIALPGRFLVFMPTVNHTGVSRKIESDGERRRLKEILLSEKGEASGGFIVRTAASGASEEELRSDLRFLLNLWADIKQRSESSKSPALIYHDLNLVERILRDQVTDNFSAIWVDTETEYERVLRFLQRFQPSLIRRVKLYTKETPLFEQFGITEEINKALRSKVWLKSGGSIVINQTEALVAIDINTGKFVGKTARLEDTIVKTNLDAIPEIVRQIRLRDLGGIIIIDFIDMDERKNRNKVMAALEEELKSDRAPSKVLQFNDFGLVAITRKRVKQSLERTLSTTCNVCVGTGMVKSPVTVCNDIYVEMRKMQKHLDRGDIMLRVHPDVVKQLKSSTKWLQEMEEMVGKTILVKSDPSLHPEQFDIH
ncbi:MAG TPA: Rne/Rng family ribonuclease [Edaphobacter sp.]|uniref:Rne/Rng family ribonuclease n=1 Tax=Edaphobacter sp. TaxID=1934404 RepID=UPI002BE16A7B|nr:Rne/Rng family ribonuclease [Edaphobacter sp.]HUZ96148.1 Rne/Rng family ribonuclease [Edaphobacter sp.]